MRGALVVASLTALACLAAGTALASEPAPPPADGAVPPPADTPPETTAPPAAERSAAPDGRAQAKELYNFAMADMEAGRYHRAAVSFDHAYTLYPNHVLLWNAARAHHSAGNYALARERYLSCLTVADFPLQRRERAAHYLVEVELALRDLRQPATRDRGASSNRPGAFDRPLPGASPQPTQARPRPRRKPTRRRAPDASVAEQAPAYAPGTQPMRYAARPLVLPAGTLNLAGAMGLSHVGGTALFGINAAVGFGLTEGVEIGAAFLPLQLAPTVAYDLPSIYGQIRAQQGNYEVGVSMELLMGVRTNTAWIFSVGSPTILRAGDIFRINTGGYLDFVFSNPLGVNFRLPFDMSFNILDELYVTLYTGWLLPRFDFNSFTMPLGVGAAYTFDNDVGAPFVDLITALRWPFFLSLANPDTVDGETVQFTVAARFYFYL